jgi:hypothetical protein
MTEQPPSDPKTPLVHRMVSTAMLTFGLILLSVAAFILYEQLTERRADDGWRTILAVASFLSLLLFAVPGIGLVVAGVMLRRPD